MKISKWLLVLCALAAGATGLTVRADDNPAQAAARIALAQKLFELNAQQPPATNAAAAVQPSATQTSDKAMTMAPVMHTEAKADWSAASAIAKPEDDKKLEAQRAAQMAALAAALGEKPTAAMPAKSEAQVKPEHETAAAQPVASSPVMVAPHTASPPEANYIGKDLGMKPIVAPALPISASKEEQLQALDMRYKADLISPDEYQKQRAAILAEP